MGNQPPLGPKTKAQKICNHSRRPVFVSRAPNRPLIFFRLYFLFVFLYTRGYSSIANGGKPRQTVRTRSEFTTGSGGSHWRRLFGPAFFGRGSRGWGEAGPPPRICANLFAWHYRSAVAPRALAYINSALVNVDSPFERRPNSFVFGSPRVRPLALRLGVFHLAYSRQADDGTSITRTIRSRVPESHVSVRSRAIAKVYKRLGTNNERFIIFAASNKTKILIRQSPQPAVASPRCAAFIFTSCSTSPHPFSPLLTDVRKSRSRKSSTRYPINRYTPPCRAMSCRVAACRFSLFEKCGNLYLR